MNITATIIISIFLLIFIGVLIKKDILISMWKFLEKFPAIVKIVLYAATITSLIYIIIILIKKFK